MTVLHKIKISRLPVSIFSIYFNGIKTTVLSYFPDIETKSKKKVNFQKKDFEQYVFSETNTCILSQEKHG